MTAPDAAVGSRGARVGIADLVLSVVAVIALAVSQPVLDVLGRAPEFFVARGSPTIDVVLLALLVGIGVPLVAGGLVAAVAAIDRRAGDAVHAVVLTLGGALITVAVLAHTPAASWAVGAVLALAGAAGGALVVAYRRSPALRAGFRIAGVAPLAVAGIFLLLAPTSRLVWGTAGQAMAAGPVARPAPVVMLVFDELPVATLIDADGELRASRFPGFARLAAGATWFRNAVGVHERTEEALPSMLTGVVAPLDENVPTLLDYPDNLFTLLGPSYHVEAVESVTALCPPSVCIEETRLLLPFGARWRSLGSDVAVVAGHVLLPDEMADRLPSIEEGWGDYAAARTPEEWELNRRFNEAVDADRRVGIAALLDEFDQPLGDGELRFAHLLVPHAPWTLLPDGRSYVIPRVPPGDWTPWTDDAWLVAQAYQQHLLQTQYVDRVVGEVIARLEASGSYDDALVVVAADHGVAIRPGLERRIVTPGTVGDLAAVPLFVKLPGQTEGTVTDARAETTDILPTVAAALGVEVPWRITGVDLFGADLPDRTASTMASSYGSVTFGVTGHEKLAVVRYHDGWFPGGDPFALAPPGHADLLGVDVAELPVAAADGADLSLDQRFPADPDAGSAPVVVSGRITGIAAGAHVIAVAVDGEIVALTRTWPDGAGSAFAALVPPGALDDGSVPSLFVVEGTGAGRTLARTE